MLQEQFEVGDLVKIGAGLATGRYAIVLRSNHWKTDQYLNGEIEVVDIWDKGNKVQYPARYLSRVG